MLTIGAAAPSVSATPAATLVRPTVVGGVCTACGRAPNGEKHATYDLL